MAKLIFLGTSASIPTKNRDNTSFIFSHRKKIFLVDCPGSIYQKLLKSGIKLKSVKRIIITHHHPDHVYGIISLIHCRCLLDRSPLYIFSNRTCIGLIKKLVKLFSLEKKSRTTIRYVDVFKRKFFYSEKEIKMRAIRNSHVKDSFGIYIKTPGTKLFYSSDTSFVPSVIENNLPLDYLIHDCTASSHYFSRYPRLYDMHTSSLQLKNLLKNDKKLKLIPVHFLLLEKGEMKNIKKELKAGGKRVIFPQDFSQIKI